MAYKAIVKPYGATMTVQLSLLSLHCWLSINHEDYSHNAIRKHKSSNESSRPAKYNPIVICKQRLIDTRGYFHFNMQIFTEKFVDLEQKSH